MLTYTLHFSKFFINQCYVNRKEITCKVLIAFGNINNVYKNFDRNINMQKIIIKCVGVYNMLKDIHYIYKYYT